MKNDKNYSVGDLLEVTTKDDRNYKCIVVESYDGGFVGKVLQKDKGVGTASWNRFNLETDGRFQSIDDCKSIEVVAEATSSKASGALYLNESVNKSDMTYYTTPIDESTNIIFCLCEGYGGWAIASNDGDSADALKESFFNSQLSKYNDVK